MLYEGLKHNATIVIVPSTAVESMQLGTVAGNPSPMLATQPATSDANRYTTFSKVQDA